MIALITGATSGIGWHTALMFAKNNYEVIITGRRLNRLLELEELIKSQYKVDVKILNFDIRNSIETEEVLKELNGKWLEIDVLVNNAGLAKGLDPIYEGEPKDWEVMIDTNIKGLLYVSRYVIPLMIKRNKGHIINISSIAGLEVYPKGNVYCATNHAVEALTKAMRMELLPYNIKVTSVAPGMVKTEFSYVRLQDHQKAEEVYKGFTPLKPEDIANVIEFIINLPEHVNINEIVVMPTAQANSTIVNRITQ